MVSTRIFAYTHTHARTHARGHAATALHYPEDVNLAPAQRESPHVVEDVRPPIHLFIVPKAPAQFIRARDGAAPVMLAPLWSRAAHEPCGLWTWPRGGV